MIYDKDLLNAIRESLVKEKKTLSVAESVTSGHLQAAFSAATEASRFFQGGITVYNLGQKCRHLNIEPVHAMENDCVSEYVATRMAEEVNRLFISDYGIAITGYATLVPETGVNELFAWFAITKKEKVLISKKISTSKKDSVDVQLDYTHQILQALKKLLESNAY